MATGPEKVLRTDGNAHQQQRGNERRGERGRVRRGGRYREGQVLLTRPKQRTDAAASVRTSQWTRNGYLRPLVRSPPIMRSRRLGEEFSCSSGCSASWPRLICWILPWVDPMWTSPSRAIAVGQSVPIAKTIHNSMVDSAALLMVVIIISNFWTFGWTEGSRNEARRCWSQRLQIADIVQGPTAFHLMLRMGARVISTRSLLLRIVFLFLIRNWSSPFSAYG
jgi:hypothetical protein